MSEENIIPFPSGESALPVPELQEVNYCGHCASGKPLADLIVITRRANPYIQCDDGMVIYACRRCYKREEGEIPTNQKLCKQCGGSGFLFEDEMCEACDGMGEIL